MLQANTLQLTFLSLPHFAMLLTLWTDIHCLNCDQKTFGGMHLGPLCGARSSRLQNATSELSSSLSIDFPMCLHFQMQHFDNCDETPLARCDELHSASSTRACTAEKCSEIETRNQWASRDHVFQGNTENHHFMIGILCKVTHFNHDNNLDAMAQARKKQKKGHDRMSCCCLC